MKIRLEHGGSVFECERKPMKEGRFRALCGLCAAGLYVGLTIGVSTLCGLPGLITVVVASLLAIMVSLVR